MKSSYPAQSGGIIKTLLLILGAITFLIILGVVAGGWYAKTKIDEAGGLQAFSGKMMTKGLEMLQPEIEKSLATEDRQRLTTLLDEFRQAAPRLTPQQIQDIGLSVETLSQKMGNGTLSETDAKAFIDDLNRLLHPPADILDSSSVPSSETTPPPHEP